MLSTDDCMVHATQKAGFLRKYRIHQGRNGYIVLYQLLNTETLTFTNNFQNNPTNNNESEEVEPGIHILWFTHLFVCFFVVLFTLITFISSGFFRIEETRSWLPRIAMWKECKKNTKKKETIDKVRWKHQSKMETK